VDGGNWVAVDVVGIPGEVGNLADADHVGVQEVAGGLYMVGDLLQVFG